MQDLINLYMYYRDMQESYWNTFWNEMEFAKYRQFEWLDDAVAREIEARI